MKLLISFLLLLAATVSPAAEIFDHAHLFSPVAFDAARDKLRFLEQETTVDTIIETILASPVQTFRSPAEKDQYFKDLLADTARRRHATGVFVLICKQPGRIQVDIHRSITAQRPQQTDQIRDAALPAFKRKDFDDGLFAITREITRQFGGEPTIAKMSAEAAQDVPSPPSVEPAERPVPASRLADKKVGNVEVSEAEQSRRRLNIMFIIAGAFAIVIVCVAVLAWPKESSASYVAPQREPARAPKPAVSDMLMQGKSQGRVRPSTPAVSPGITPAGSGIDPLTAGVVGYALGSTPQTSPPPPAPVSEPARRAPDPEPERKSDDSSWGGGSGGNFGGLDLGSGSSFGGGGGGGFDGGSGGDF